MYVPPLQPSPEGVPGRQSHPPAHNPDQALLVPEVPRDADLSRRGSNRFQMNDERGREELITACGPYFDMFASGLKISAVSL
jgi:hypothetical protein